MDECDDASLGSESDLVGGEPVGEADRAVVALVLVATLVATFSSIFLGCDDSSLVKVADGPTPLAPLRLAARNAAKADGAPGLGADMVSSTSYSAGWHDEECL